MAKAIETLSPEDQTIFLEAINDAIETDPGSTKTSLGGVIGGSTGTVDNAILRADGTAGDALKSSGLVVGDAFEVVTITGITGVASTNTITATGSGFSNGQPIRFTALTGGSGLNTTTNYFVRDVSGDSFSVETSIGGGAVNFTTNITAGTLAIGHIRQAVVAVSQNTPETNSALVLAPKGNGAFILGPPPDGTAVGGNARGANAVDLQTVRGGATSVASGQSSFAAGNNNTASGIQSFIAGGVNNSATGSNAFVAGSSNSASGITSLCLGSNSAASDSCSITIGNRSSSDRVSQFSHSSGAFSNVTGSAQFTCFVLGQKTTTDTPVSLKMTGNASNNGGGDFGNANARPLTIPSGKVFSFITQITGIKSDGSAVAKYIREGTIKNVGGTTTLVGSVITVGTDHEDNASTDVAITADDTNDALDISVTGIDAETWRWVAVVQGVEIAYGT